ncbi:MAG TPA: VOC family protein [Pyrinomonadaceae bacterium]|nr:VOC family protein [Pyrinomonadaceae bacterium]
METKLTHIRHGFGSVRPYIYGGLTLPDFVEYVFGARQLERHDFNERSFHYEGQLGDSVIVIEAGDLPAHESGTKSSIYVYVADVDATFARALERGAITINAPEEKPYQERQAGFKDASGNTWWISTYTGA